ncbi:Putative fluoride ion transporter CrcB [Paraburkholderia saeva]|nr:Putative fluoride ion transporter CrcB [Paraburkholderia saeva]
MIDCGPEMAFSVVLKPPLWLMMPALIRETGGQRHVCPHTTRFIDPPGSLKTMYLSILAVGLGGALGSLLRWLLGLRLNTLLPELPLGTLASNIIAGYVIGVAVAGFARYPGLAPEWRLFVITGLMGGLSTFSTFSAEVVSHLQQGRPGWAVAEIAVHVGSSLAMTLLGIGTVALITR